MTTDLDRICRNLTAPWGDHPEGKVGWGTAHPNISTLAVPPTQLHLYNTFDLHWTAQLHDVLTRELRSNNQLPYWRNRIVPRVEAGMAMAARGLRVDPAEVSRLRSQLTAELKETEAVVREVAPTLNFASPKQRAEFLHGAPPAGLGLPLVSRTAKGAPSTNQDSLDRLLKRIKGVRKYEGAIPILHALFHRSRLSTILSRYLDLPIDRDGRVRPRLRMYGAATGRWSYTEPAIHQYPSECRSMFVAAPGHLLVSADYSQVEARIFAWVVGLPTMLETFRQGGDVHTMNALILFGWSPTHWETLTPTMRKAARNAAKVFLYGVCLYGGQAESVHSKLFCPCPRCAERLPPTISQTRTELRVAQDRWMANHPQVLLWRERVVREVLSPGGSRTYTNPFGQKRYFSGWGPEVERQLFNYPCQSTAMDLISEAQVELHRRGCPIILQHHDSLVAEVPEGEVDRWASLMQSIMTCPRPEIPDLPLAVDVEVGRSWGTLRPI